MRVRFAPSNTGNLHIGGARTALYNWLVAKQNKGQFILRIEDTDLERSKPEFTRDILDSLKWLGLDWDEGPEFQTQRFAKGLYQPFIDKLLTSGSAYRCFCTKERLEAMAAASTKKQLGYDRKCRNLTADESDALVKSKQPYVVRVKIPLGHSAWKDGIQGDVSWNNRDLSDEILIRSDGSPTYNFVVVCDDILMGITQVIRGADHSSNTPKQLQIYNALGVQPPQFSHIPLIFGPDGKKLSKRNPCVFQGQSIMTEVRQYRNAGYLPEAVINYLVLLGWGFDDHTEVFSKVDLIEKFNLSKVSVSPARFDPRKLEHFQGVYVRNLPDMIFDKIVEDHLITGGIFPDGIPPSEMPRVKLLAKAEKQRIRALGDLAPKARPLFTDASIKMDDEATRVFYHKLDVTKLIGPYRVLLESESFDNPDALEQHARDFAKGQGCKFSDFVHPIRAALTGTTTGPKLFELMKICGKSVVIKRLQEAELLIVASQTT